MFFDKLGLDRFLRRRGSEGSNAKKPSLAHYLSRGFGDFQRQTWFKELRTVAGLVTRRQAPPVYGVDIGSTSVRIMKLSNEDRLLEVTAFACADMPDEVIVDGEVVDPDAVAGVIETAMAEQGLEPGYAVTGLSGRAVIVRKITMEKTDPDLARETLAYDAAEHIQFEPGEVCLDLHVLSSPQEGETMDVLLVAAKRPVVELQASILTTAGFAPAVVDVDSFAMSNAYLANYEPESDEDVGILNIGNYVTSLAVLRRSTPWVMRDLAIGTHSFAEKLQELISVEKHRAKDVLFGSPERGDPVLPQVVTEVGGDLVSEIERSLAFADTDASVDRLNRLLLSGGGCRILGLSELLSDRLAVPVEIADPFRKLSWSEDVLLDAAPEDIAHRFMIATGLALRGVRI